MIFLICALLLAFALHAFLPIGRSRAERRLPADRSAPDTIDRDDDRYWIGGVIYNNPDDPDLFVPKRHGFGFGRTVNFGHTLGKIILIGPLLLPLVLAVLKALSQR